jgi:hypothetical protein
MSCAYNIHLKVFYKMPTSIPFHPSLVLGNIVDEERLNKLIQIAELKAPIDAAMNDLNADIELRRSLDLTRQELMNLKIDPSDLDEPLKKANEAILESAKLVADRKIEAGPKINQIRASMPVTSKSFESPIDYNRTMIKQMPLSSDSIEMDAQYFSFEENSQSSQATISKIKAFVAASTSFLGNERSVQASTQAERQVAQQAENHSLSGTLIITANCTHKDAALLAPFILDVDKGVRVWNEVVPDKKIKIDSVSNVQQIAQEEGTDQEKKIHLLSGATYGSSFIGMVHVLKTESTVTSQDMLSTASKLQAQMKTGGWFAKASGGFGVDASFARDVKNMLSTQQISSHISIVAMGCIPNIKSNEVQLGVKTLADFDPSKMMGKLATLANATNSDRESMDEAAASARTGGQMIAIRGAEIQNVMSGLSEIDSGQNKMLDINSLMTAFEDYVEKALAGNIGVPINFYLKSITRAQLAQMWVAKYYPGEYLAISGDDSEPQSGGDE